MDNRVESITREMLNSIEEVADLWAAIRRFRLMEMAAEARALLAATDRY